MTHRAPETHTGDHDALAVGWAMHTLEPDEATAFEAHLETCPTCRRTVDDTTEIECGDAQASDTGDRGGDEDDAAASCDASALTAAYG